MPRRQAFPINVLRERPPFPRPLLHEPVEVRVPPAAGAAGYPAAALSTRLQASSASTSAISFAVSFHDAAILLASTCSGVLAPAIMLHTSGRAASHENARSSSECPRDSANPIRVSTRSRFSGVKIFGPKASLPRLDSGNGLPLRYLPVSSPFARGK